MIAQLRGEVSKKFLEHIYLLTGNIGYKVYLPTALLSSINENERIELFTHLVVREDQLSLYGFKSFEQLQLFEHLLGVSGVGPKMALKVISTASVESIRQAIVGGDTVLFTRVPGIGKKNAARIVLELRSKLESEIPPNLLAVEGDLYREAESALKNLGYSTVEIRKALANLDKKMGLAEMVKEALKSLQ